MLNRVRNPDGSADRVLQADPLKALIASDPSRLEAGLQIVDTDLQAGAAGVIDLVGIDRSGALVILHIAPQDADRGLLRLMDQCSWALDQRRLLDRIYAARGLAAGRPTRCLIVARGFTQQFLGRLPLLTIEVTPYLARLCGAGPGAHVTLEPAAPAFGLPWSLPEDREPARPAAAVPAGPDFQAPGWEVPQGSDLVEPGTADPLSPDELELEALDIEATPGPVEPIETLTAEEMEEFERFDRQRRQRDRSSP